MTSQTRSYSVPAISCRHCIDAITTEVCKLADVRDVSIDLDTKVVTVVGTPADADVIAAIDEAGFEVAV
ncbi:MAG: heavy-metal-associated domain-containing protein [Acidimicrobiales bacterium]